MIAAPTVHFIPAPQQTGATRNSVATRHFSLTAAGNALSAGLQAREAVFPSLRTEDLRS